MSKGYVGVGQLSFRALSVRPRRLARMPTKIADWRATELASQRLAAELHKAAAVDLASSPELWPALPTDGLARELLAARTNSKVPSIHLSSSAGQLALIATVAEMGERRASRVVRWHDGSLEAAANGLRKWVPALCNENLPALACQLPALEEARYALAALNDADLARLSGRVLESALSCYWLFGSRKDEPQRVWHPWIAKQKGCFFTPQFIARHMAREALRGEPGPLFDPAVGAGALLIEAFLLLEPQIGRDKALRALHGVDVDPALVELAAVALTFLAGKWADSAPLILGSQIVTGDALLAPFEGDVSWRSWFPAVFEQVGFGAAVMNPPYGQLKVNQSTLPRRDKDSKKARSIREKALEQARASAATTAAALRAHPDYRSAHGGVPDLPRFFIERALSLLREGGRLACIVPSTFLADHRSRAFRRHLLDDHNLRELNLVPEDARLFPDVNQPTCVMVVESGRRTSAVRVRRKVLAGADLRRRPDVSVSRRLIEAVDPDERRIPNCAPEDLAPLRQMHEHPSLADIDWIVNLRGELDLTIDAKYLKSEAPGHRLIRGDQIERYRDDLPSEKKSWVDHAFLTDRISKRKSAFLKRRRIVVRQCSYLRKPRRISAVLVEPGVVVANSCNFLAVGKGRGGKPDDDGILHFLLGVLNSSILEWRFRATNSTNHVGNYELAALPIPIPDERAEVAEVMAASRALLLDPSDSSTDSALERAVRALYGLSPGAGR
jgi:Alw26I/Eco31I/Esp3I family type II restriction m6 adenine DNA methyltransferase